MRYLFSATLMCATLFAGTASYANDVWRCGNVYTNQASEADISSGRCKLVNNDVSVVPAPGRSTGTSISTSGEARPQVGGASSQTEEWLSQEARQRQSREVQARIDRAVEELNALEDEYKNGEPDRMGPEFRNYQKYLDRVERLKGEIEAKKQEIATLRSQL